LGKVTPAAATLTRGLEILRCFSRSGVALGSSDIARLTGYSQPTVWRLCQTLLQQGYLVSVGDSGKFRPGLSVLALGFAALEDMPLSELALPLMQDLSKRFYAAVGLTTRERSSMLFVQRCEVDAILTLNVRTGSRVPLVETATGWAYLAGLPDPQRDELSRELEREDPKKWRQCAPLIRNAIAEYESTGIVVNEGHFVPTLNSVATPLRRPVEGRRYVLICSGQSSQLPSSVLRGDLAEAMLSVKQALDAAAPSSPT
jgi:DNA-binding IclR family transcriptional regulator